MPQHSYSAGFPDLSFSAVKTAISGLQAVDTNSQTTIRAMYDTSGGTYNGSQYDTLARLEVRYQYDNKTAPYTAAENFASIMMGLNNASGISAPEPDKASYRTAILNRM